MLTVSGRSSPFLSVGKSSLCDIVYVYRANLSQHQLCKVRIVMHVMGRHRVEARETGSGDRTGVAIQDPEPTTQASIRGC